MSCKVFLLSTYECGYTFANGNDIPVDGSKLTYFELGTGSSANNKRIANLNGSAAFWWLRSPRSDVKPEALYFGILYQCHRKRKFL